MQPTLTASDAERFWSKVRKTSTCWEWTGQLDRKGYGAFWVVSNGDRRNLKAHRVSLLLVGEGIPPAKVVDHICRVRHCVNPEHLRAVTNGENVLAGIGPTAINARKTHCPQGHAYTPGNIHQRADGARRCLACIRSKVACPECGKPIGYRALSKHRRNQHGYEY